MEALPRCSWPVLLESAKMMWGSKAKRAAHLMAVRKLRGEKELIPKVPMKCTAPLT